MTFVSGGLPGPDLPTHPVARQNCSYSLHALREMIPRCLGPEGVSDELVWKFFERVDRIHRADLNGETYGTAAVKERVYRSHRRVRVQTVDGL
jgi:hypothetical protein